MESLSKVTAAREFDLAWPVLACAVGCPDDESRLRLRRLYLESGPAVELWVYGEPQRSPTAVIGIRLGDPVEITHVAVQEGGRRQGLGRRLFAHMQARHPDTTRWMAETDDDAVGFYRALGFQAEVLPSRYAGVRRYRCIWTSGGARVGTRRCWTPAMHAGHLGRKQIKTLETARLTWIPWTLETMDAFSEGRPEAAARVWNAAVPHDFPNGPYRENLSYFRQVLASSRAGLDGVIIEREHRTVIGGMGFRTPSASFEALGLLRASPALEIGFGILASYWNRGYATEMARALTSQVLGTEAAQVVAESEEDNAASIRVLEKAGFHRIGRSGTLLLWDHGESARA